MTSDLNFGPEFMDRYILLRRERYIDLGLHVNQLSEDIRDKLKIDSDHGWKPKDSLLRSKKQILRIKSKSAFNKKLKKAERMMHSKQHLF